MHAYERHILHTLTLRGEARYRDLKPSKAESNLFVYHLKKLTREGYIGKKGTAYVLTAAGNRYVDKLSLASFEPRSQPKIVTVVICTNKEGKYLIYTRKREPFYGMKGFPYGKIHVGETIGEAADRELYEKCGITASLVHKGDMYLTIHKGGELVTAMLCHIFLGANPEGAAKTTASGECSWEDIRTVQTHSFIPGFLEMLELTKKKARFFEEKVISA
jgi:ADP-ribose pyrophosphatase YjhB (NUDIX family)